MNLIANERTKLTANWLNGLATAIVTAGALAPLAALLYGLSSPTVPLAYLSLFVAACLVFGVVIHLSARIILRGLLE